jgi:hypothetical protein
MARKTVDVEFVKEKVNRDISGEGADLVEAWVNMKIKEGYTPAQAVRLAFATVLEGILFHTDNYRGFRSADGANGTSDPTKREYF